MTADRVPGDHGRVPKRVRHIVYEVTVGSNGLMPTMPAERDIAAIVRYHPNADPRRPILGELEVEWEE